MFEGNDRFWSKMVLAGPDECWTWQRTKNRQGYGMFSVGDKNVLAHRFAWGLANGPIPEKMHVLHKCDNPPCCNPAHLFLGTHSDNMRDMFAKGRCSRRKGERNINAKLTEEGVREIRRLYATGQYKLRDIAAMYDVHLSLIHLVVKRKIWEHVE